MRVASIGLVALVAAVGCGTDRSHGTDPAAVKRAQAVADEMEMAGLAMQGYELPTDGGPMVLYGRDDCLPGTKHGPCKDESCGHKLCDKARTLASRKCELCGKPVGYGAEATPVDSDGKPVTSSRDATMPGRAVHFDCWKSHWTDICPECHWPLSVDCLVVGGKAAHDPDECQRCKECGPLSDDELQRRLDRNSK